MIDIFVVNLESSPERRENISAQLKAQELAFNIFPAVDGRSDPHPLFKKYNEALSHRFKGKSLSRGQLGCYASHYLLWQHCVKLNKPVIILEDDAVLDSKLFPAFCAYYTELPAEIGFIRLHANQRKRFSSYEVYNKNGITIHRFNKGHMGTIGYFLTPKAAQQFIDASSQWIFPVDIMMDRFWATNVECYGIVPECVTHNDDEQSDIGYGKKSQRSFLTRCKREWFNFNELIKRETHNLCFKINNSKK